MTSWASRKQETAMMRTIELRQEPPAPYASRPSPSPDMAATNGKLISHLAPIGSVTRWSVKVVLVAS